MESIQPTYISAVQQMRAYRALRADVHEVLDLYSLNSSQWAILGHLYEHLEGATVGELAHLLDVKAPLISILTIQLLERNLLGTKETTSDKRTKCLLISSDGISLVNEVERLLVTHSQPMFATLSKRDIRSYHKVLQTIISYKN